MRISDWSSDVCSSDLVVSVKQDFDAITTAPTKYALPASPEAILQPDRIVLLEPWPAPDRREHLRAAVLLQHVPEAAQLDRRYGQRPAAVAAHHVHDADGLHHGGDALVDAQADEQHRREQRHHRSEEHTSELQSLMRISNTVFCLKQK